MALITLDSRVGAWALQTALPQYAVYLPHHRMAERKGHEN